MLEFLRQANRRIVAIVIPLAAIAALVAVLFFWGPRRGAEQASGEIWTCSMHPQVRLPRPGPCPICGMALIPVSQLESEQARVKQKAGLESEPVVRRELFKEIRTVGKLDYSEPRVKLITARTSGRVDRVYVDFTGITVKAKHHLVDIYSPDLVSAQQELLLAARREQTPGLASSGASSLTASARQRLLLWGITEEQIAEVLRTGQARTHLTIYAPIGGVVIEKNVREQQYVKEGDMLYRIAELDPIWLYLDIYEYDLAWIRYGQPVEVSVEAYPGENFHGTVVFRDPFLNDPTRTVKVRVNLKNPDYRLLANMYASAKIHVRLQADGTPQPTGLEGKYICPMHPEVVRDEAGRCDICEMDLERVPDLFPARRIIPAETPTAAADNATHALAIRKSAVLDTGRRQVAYRKRKDGAYELAELKLGPLAEAKDEAGRIASFYPVLAGLAEGDEVVVQGGFLLDSQRQIEGMPSLLYVEGQSAAALHAGHGGGGAPPPPQAAPASEHKHGSAR
jgi:Cu(I)/Ag(I) efflux system membrane fusion protein